MSNLFMQIGLSNACFSLALAIIAMVVGAKARRPHLAYLLWLLVLVKLLTPPLVSVPVIILPELDEPVAAVIDNSPQQIVRQDGMAPVALSAEIEGTENTLTIAGVGSQMLHYARASMPPIWLFGSVVVLAWSLIRVYRFNRLLTAESEVAPQKLQTAAMSVAQRLALSKTPTIYTTSARLSPMVWWAGGKVRIIIPQTLLDHMDASQQELILAHELAHVRRRDHFVRWVEWLCCVCFWWNPVVWLAQRNLRAMEEICCDEMVVSSLNTEPKCYANTLLSIVEFLAHPAIRPPAMASEINSGGILERRFRMIISKNTSKDSSRRLQLLVLLLALIVLPLGMAYAQDKNDRAEKYLDGVWAKLEAAVEAGEMTEEEAREKMLAVEDEMNARIAKHEAIAAKIKAAVEAGEITEEEARAKMAAMKKKGHDKKDIDYEAIGRRLKEAVKSGKMTEEEAMAKWEAIKKGDHGKKDIDIEAIAKKIRAAVEAGEITPEEGREKMAGLRRRAAAKRDVDIEAIGKKIRAAVQAGEMTPEQGRAKMTAIREKMAQGQRDRDGAMRERYAAAVEKIKAALEAGEITEEEAAAKFAALRSRIAASRDSGDRDRGGDLRARYAAAVEKIKAAVEAGEITEEEAEAKIAALRQRIAASRERSDKGEGDGMRERYAAVVEKIKAALEAGEITEEEAAAKFAALRSRIAASRERGDRDEDGSGQRRRR